MSFLIKILVSLAFFIGIQFYFINKSSRIISRNFPGFSQKNLELAKKFLLLFLNLYPVMILGYWLYFLISGNRNIIIPPESFLFDWLIIYPFWFLFILIAQVTFYFLFTDLLKLILFPLFNRIKTKWLLFEGKLLMVLFILFSLYVPYRFIYDYNTINVREVIYKKNNLPRDLQGFKIALISDVQADRYTNSSRLEKFMSKVNSEHPDLILVAGDIITGSPKYINTAANYLGELKAEYGIYSCIGDHDNWAYRSNNKRSIMEITHALESKHIPMIDNGKVILKTDSSTIDVTFLTNTYVESISDSEFNKLTSGSSKYDLRIMLTHQPGRHLIDKAIENNYDLYFAGHTHGGQITFLLPFLTFSPTSFETKYIRGDYWFGNMLLIVTPGLGMSIAPVRYNSTPEITMITLQSSRHILIAQK